MSLPREPAVRIGVLSRTIVTALVLVASICAPSSAQAPRARQGLVSLDDARLFYEVLGTGEPIVVIHGGPGLDHGYLRPGLDALAVRNMLVYYDQRGTGRSTATLDERAISLDAFVGDVEALREALNLERMTLVAHSFGSLIGIEYAARHPDRVRALILLNPVDPGDRYADATAARHEARRSAEDAAELERLRATEGFAAQDPATLSEVYRLSFRAALREPNRVAELSLDLAEATAKNGSEVARLLGSSIGGWDGWARLRDVTVPTLVVHGRYDLPPTEMAQDIVAQLPQGSLSILDSGHFPYLEDPQGLLAAIGGFLAAVPR